MNPEKRMREGLRRSRSLTDRSGGKQHFHLRRSISAEHVFKPCSTYPLIAKDGEAVMAPKAHGTSKCPVQENLRWGCNYDLADRLCNFNSLRKVCAEPAGYWRQTKFFEEAKQAQAEDKKITFYDSNSGKPLFHAPIGRSWDEFIQDSTAYGWLSFRDEECVWDNVRCLEGTTITVSLSGTHLGSNMPDRHGNRYCINLVAIAGHHKEEDLLLNWNSDEENEDQDMQDILAFIERTGLGDDHKDQSPCQVSDSSTMPSLKYDASSTNSSTSNSEVVFCPWPGENPQDDNDDECDEEDDTEFLPWPSSHQANTPSGVTNTSEHTDTCLRIDNMQILLDVKNKRKQDACSFGSEGSAIKLTNEDLTNTYHKARSQHMLKGFAAFLTKNKYEQDACSFGSEGSAIKLTK